MSDRSAALLQRLLPKKAITQFGSLIADAHAGPITHAIIRWFIKRYGVNMDEAADPRVESYASFNLFFTRALREGVRPLADVVNAVNSGDAIDAANTPGTRHAPWLCPVDGAISQFGTIERDQIFQAKGHHYSTRALVGGDAQLAAQFDDGSFTTLYLSPKDYHRIHMPARGTLRRMIYVPGDLYSVNPQTARMIPGLFARNERVVCVFESAGSEQRCPFALVLVGAAIVGSMATVWHGVVNPPRTRDVREWRYEDGQVVLERGAEMGRFLLGSTVVMLFPQGALRFNPEWAPERAIRMGEAMGTIEAPAYPNDEQR